MLMQGCPTLYIPFRRCCVWPQFEVLASTWQTYTVETWVLLLTEDTYVLITKQTHSLVNEYPCKEKVGNLHFTHAVCPCSIQKCTTPTQTGLYKSMLTKT